MKEPYNSIVPRISINAKIKPIDNGEYVISEMELGYHLKINEEVKKILDYVDGEKSIGEICSITNRELSKRYDSLTIHNLFYDQLAKYGIILSDTVNVEKNKKLNYLKLRIELISETVTNRIARPLSVLFNRILFQILMIVLPIFICIVLVVHFNEFKTGLDNMFTSKFIFYILLFGVWVFVHEFGHSAACNSFGIRTGGIGFGFYFISPVLYSDVSNIWSLKKKQRNVVNLGGIYFELILASILLFMYLVLEYDVLLILPMFLILSTVYNLNPLLKFDGYWILSDSLGISNLHKVAYGTVWNFFRRTSSFQFHRKNIFLLIYGLISMSYILIFILLALYFDANKILYFPIRVGHLIIEQDFSSLSVDMFYHNLLPIIFYYLLFRFSFKSFQHINKKKQTKYSISR